MNSPLFSKCHTDTLFIFDLLLYVAKVHKNFAPSSKRNHVSCGLYDCNNVVL